MTSSFRHRILVVDDLPDNLSLLSMMLNQQGYEVRRAPNGMMALNNVPRYQPHLILLDIMMPGMDGYEVCEALKNNPQTVHIPVIFLSALYETFDKVRAFKLGAVDYITKPFEVEEVLLRVKQQLDLQDLQSQLQSQNLRLQNEVRERSRAEAEAYKASQTKSRFLAHMSHELRTPLSTIIGYADLMLTDPDRSLNDRQCLNAILNSSFHLLTLIEDVLNMTKIEAGRIRIDEAEFDLFQFLQDLEGMFRLQAQTHDLEFKIEADATLPPRILGDAVKLRQVLINLISNAIKFTQKGFVNVRAMAWPCNALLRDDRGGDGGNPEVCKHLLQFQVQDTGPGIALEEQDRLFQPFEQTQTGRSAKTGSGLGLAISRNFIRVMGGDIFVNSQPNQGTCFTVEVIVKSVLESGIEAGNVPTSDCIQLTPRPKVLMVLQDPDLRQWVPQFIQEAGYEVQLTESLDEAWTFWQQESPAIVVLEWGRSIAENETFLDKIHPPSSAPHKNFKGRESQTFIIALAMEADPNLKTMALEKGCDQVLLPPHRPKDLILTLLTACDRDVNPAAMLPK